MQDKAGAATETLAAPAAPPKTVTHLISALSREPSTPLEEVPKECLVEARELLLQEQAAQGKPPGVQILKNREKFDHWGVVPPEVYDEGAAQVDMSCPWDDPDCVQRQAVARAAKLASTQQEPAT